MLMYSKYIVSLLPTGFGERLIYQLAPLVVKYSNPIVVNADWLKASPVVSKTTPIKMH